MRRKAHGTAFASDATVRAEQHRFVEGDDTIERDIPSPSMTRSFCGCCGSALLRVDLERSPAHVSCPLGALETPIAIDEHRRLHVNARAT